MFGQIGSFLFRIRSSVAAGLTCGMLVSVAHGTLIQFDAGFQNDDLLNTQYASDGAIFFSPETFTAIRNVEALGGSYRTCSSPNAAFAAFDNELQGTLRIDFAGPASNVSFCAVDVGASSRDAIAYDSDDIELQTITIHNPGSGPGIGNIDPVTFTESDIAYVTFGQGSIFESGDGSLIDDLSFVITGPGTGACCMGDDCQTVYEDFCVGAGGTYLGDGTVCDPDICNPVPTEPMTWGMIKSIHR